MKWDNEAQGLANSYREVERMGRDQYCPPHTSSSHFGIQGPGAQKIGMRESPVHVDTKYMGTGKGLCSGHLGESKCFQYTKMPGGNTNANLLLDVASLGLPR